MTKAHAPVPVDNGFVPPRERFLASPDRAPDGDEAPRDRGPDALLELAQ
jgi:hypothetical protein